MGQLMSILMMLGGGTSTKSTDLDATLPYNVATTALQQEEYNDEYEDVEDGRNEATAHYTNAPALGLVTLEMACRESDTEERRAGRHNLDIVNSAGQNEVNQLHGLSCGGQRQTDRVTHIWSSSSSGVEVSGSNSDGRSMKMNERLQATAYCGKSPQRRLKEIYAQLKAEQQRTSTEAIDEDRPGCPAINVSQSGAKNAAEESTTEEFQPRLCAVQRPAKNVVKNAAEKKMTAEETSAEERRLRSVAKEGTDNRLTKSTAAEEDGGTLQLTTSRTTD